VSGALAARGRQVDPRVRHALGTQPGAAARARASKRDTVARCAPGGGVGYSAADMRGVVLGVLLGVVVAAVGLGSHLAAGWGGSARAEARLTQERATALRATAARDSSLHAQLLRDLGLLEQQLFEGPAAGSSPRVVPHLLPNPRPWTTCFVSSASPCTVTPCSELIAAAPGRLGQSAHPLAPAPRCRPPAPRAVRGTLPYSPPHAPEATR
jgi:hypothetical protein